MLLLVDRSTGLENVLNNLEVKQNHFSVSEGGDNYCTMVSVQEDS